MKKIFLTLIFTFTLFQANSSFALSCGFSYDSSIEKIINKLNVIRNVKLINYYNDNYNDSDFVFIGEVVNIDCKPSNTIAGASNCSNNIKIEKILKMIFRKGG